jgi:hypothetical protein
MSIHNPRITASPTPPVFPEIAAFADTLEETDELYWPALAASDGCEASLRELNAMLEADDCEPFSVVTQIRKAIGQ